MPTFIIKESGAEVNRIVASAEFVADNYEEYELAPVSAEEKNAEGRAWRDSELERTDIMSQTPDWPNRDDWLTYRTTLRDWPSTSDFPDTRPNDPDYVDPETAE